MSDTIRVRVTQMVKFVPAGCTALLDDGSVVTGPVMLEDAIATQFSWVDPDHDKPTFDA